MGEDGLDQKVHPLRRATERLCRQEQTDGSSVHFLNTVIVQAIFSLLLFEKKSYVCGFVQVHFAYVYQTSVYVCRELPDEFGHWVVGCDACV